MALSAAELDALITDLTNQHWQLSREYSEIADQERKDEIADTMSAIDYQLARLKNSDKLRLSPGLRQTVKRQVTVRW